MKRFFIFIVLCLPLGLFAQGFGSFSHDQPFFAKDRGASSPVDPCVLAVGDGTPTNLVGYPAYTWHVAQCGFVTNAGNAVWTDYSANNLDLTNPAAGQFPIYNSSGLNGMATLSAGFGSRHIRNSTYSIPNGSKSEIVIVGTMTNVSGANNLFYDMSGSGTPRQAFKNANELSIYAGSIVTSVKNVTNKWIVWDLVYTGGANSLIYTNNVAGVSGDAGGNGMTGFLIPGGLNANNGIPMEIAELVTFRTNLSTVARSNLFTYLTNKYSISP